VRTVAAHVDAAAKKVFALRPAPALHRWAVIAEAANDRLTAAERGALVRRIAARAHAHPDGSSRRYARRTTDGLRPFLPATGSTQVVITSTDQAFAELGQAVDVAVFSRPESLE